MATSNSLMNSRETRSKERKREREQKTWGGGRAERRRERPIVREHAIPILLIRRYALGTGSSMEDCSVNKTRFGGLQGNSFGKNIPVGSEINT